MTWRVISARPSVKVAFLRVPGWPYDGLWYINRLVDFSFIMDMVLQFNLAYNMDAHTTSLVGGLLRTSTRPALCSDEPSLRV